MSPEMVKHEDVTVQVPTKLPPHEVPLGQLAGVVVPPWPPLAGAPPLPDLPPVPVVPPLETPPLPVVPPELPPLPDPPVPESEPEPPPQPTTAIIPARVDTPTRVKNPFRMETSRSVWMVPSRAFDNLPIRSALVVPTVPTSQTRAEQWLTLLCTRY